MNKRKSIDIFLVVSICILVSNLYAFAFDNEPSLSLKGLKGVYVLPTISSVLGGEELKKTGLSEEIIRTDVELKLRMAGINVISKKEDLYEIRGIPQLIITIAGIVTGEAPLRKGIAFNIHAELFQRAYLTNTQLTLAGTWSANFTGLGYTDENIVTQIRNGVKDISDWFINDYLSVNPKGEK